MRKMKMTVIGLAIAMAFQLSFGSPDQDKTREALKDFLIDAEKLDAIGEEIISESIRERT